jgi:hypothetical protein
MLQWKGGGVYFQCGGMAEWFKAAVLKTASPKGDVGSNPTPSARLRQGFVWWAILFSRRSFDKSVVNRQGFVWQAGYRNIQWDENPSPTLGGELVRRPGGEAEGAERMSTSLSLGESR